MSLVIREFTPHKAAATLASLPYFDSAPPPSYLILSSPRDSLYSFGYPGSLKDAIQSKC